MKIKDDDIRRLEYIASTASRTDTIYIRETDTIFREPDFHIDTIKQDEFVSVNIPEEPVEEQPQVQEPETEEPQVEKPVVVMIEATWKKAFVSASNALWQECRILIKITATAPAMISR